MSANPDRTFQPRLESFEGRCLPSALPFFILARLRAGGLPVVSPVVTPAVVNIFNPALLAMPPGSLVPLAGRGTGSAAGSGLNVTTSINSSPASLGLSGAATSQTIPTLGGGLTLNLSNLGTRGSLFAPATTSRSALSAAPGTAGAVPTLVSSVGITGSTFSIVPNSTSFGLTSPIQPTTVFTHGTGGLTTVGLITPASIRADTGIFLPT
jgi:hypothetical protein